MARGVAVLRAQPLVAGHDAPRTVDARNAYIMNSLLHSVATAGTGAAVTC